MEAGDLCSIVFLSFLSLFTFSPELLLSFFPFLTFHFAGWKLISLVTHGGGR